MHANGESLDAVVQMITNDQVDIALLQEVQQDGWYYHRYAQPSLHAEQIGYLRDELTAAGYRGIFAKFRDEGRYRPDTAYLPDTPMELERDENGAIIREGTHNIMTFMSSRVKGGLVHKDVATPGQSWWFSEVISTWVPPTTWENVRRMLTMKFFLPGFEPLIVINLHIVPHNSTTPVERMAEKRDELSTVLVQQGVYADHQHPVVIGGDFNMLRMAGTTQEEAASIEDAPYTWQNLPDGENQDWVRAVEEFGVEEYSRVSNWGFKDPAYECYAGGPHRSVDFIFFKRMPCSNHLRQRPTGPTGYNISDHPVLFVDFYLPPLPPS